MLKMLDEEEVVTSAVLSPVRLRKRYVSEPAGFELEMRGL